MATIAEINQTSSYTGNAGLGGGVAVGITIDPTPVARLAQFKFYRDRDFFELKQRQDKEAADQIANITAFDITSPLTPYREALKSELNDLHNFLRENPDAVVYSRNPEKYQQLKEKENRFLNLRKSATASDAIYNARKAAIDKEPDPRKRDLEMRKLDLDVKEHFANGIDPILGTPLKSTPDIKPDDYKIPEAAVSKMDMLAQGPNEISKTELSVIDVRGLMAKSHFLASGAGGEQLDENSAWFKSLSPERQQLAREEAGFSSTKRQQLVNMSQELSGLLKQYQDANPGVDISTITGDVTGTDTLMDMIKSVNNYNKQIGEVNELIRAGQLKDPTGKPVTTQYDLINIKDGLTAGELVFMNALQSAKTPILSKIEKSVQQTDNAIQQEQLANQRRGQNLDLQNSREGREAAKKLAELKGAEGSGTADVITDVAEYMLGHIQRATSTMKSRNADSISIPWGGMDDTMKGALGFTSEDTGGSYVQDKNGNITVMDADGKIKSKLNVQILKQKIAEQFHGAGTEKNINEGTQKAIEAAFRQAGLTDLNKLMGQEFKSTPRQSATTTTTQAAATELDPGGFKKEGKYWRYKDGTLYDDQGNIIK